MWSQGVIAAHVGIAPSTVVIVPGPFCIDALAHFQPGALATDKYQPGALATGLFQPGADASQTCN